MEMGNGEVLPLASPPLAAPRDRPDLPVSVLLILFLAILAFSILFAVVVVVVFVVVIIVGHDDTVKIRNLDNRHISLF